MRCLDGRNVVLGRCRPELMIMTIPSSIFIFTMQPLCFHVQVCVSLSALFDCVPWSWLFSLTWKQGRVNVKQSHLGATSWRLVSVNIFLAKPNLVYLL